jgi:hypothetical protein
VAANDSLRIAERGRQLLLTARGSAEEGAIWQQALLEYPPACRILSLLSQNSSLSEPRLSKFQLGHELGFVGDKGFTSFSEAMYVREYALAQSRGDQAKLRSNFEGDSDKYARQICSWLAGLPTPLVRSHGKRVSVEVGGEMVQIPVGAYEITSAGTSAMGSVRGTSSHRRTPKFVPVDMLATKSSGQDRPYLRLRRSIILQEVLRRPRTLADLITVLQSKSITETEAVVQADLQGLMRMGLQISRVQDTWTCSDSVIGFVTPAPTRLPLRSDIQARVEQLETELINVPLEYTALLAIGQDRRLSRQLEIKTMELLTEVCRWPGILMGGPNRPDGVAVLDGNAIIIDTKDYEEPFAISADESRKMAQYVRDARERNPAANATQWWSWIDTRGIDDAHLRFLYVANAFTGNLTEQLHRLSASVHNTPGAVISTENLLRFADQLLDNRISISVASERLGSLQEIQIYRGN